MTIIIAVFLGFVLITVRPKKDTAFLSISQTRSINGIMSGLIFILHFSQYIPAEDMGRIYRIFSGRMGQLVVVPFLAFSGYGIMVSILKKEKSYIKSIMSKRFINLWIKFALIILMYVVLNLIMGRDYPLSETLLAFTGWVSIGNSNWYIMATLIMYLVTYVSFIALPPKKYNLGILLVFILSGVYIVLMRFAGKGEWYYDTIISYPTGMLIALYKEKILSVMSRKKASLILTVAATIGFGGLFALGTNLLTFQVLELLFIAFMLVWDFKIAFKSKILEWAGEYAFELFLIARIPFIALHDVEMNMYLYFAVSLLITVAASFGFRFLTDFIFRKPKKKTA